MSRLSASLLLLLAAALWGATFVVQKWAATGVDSMRPLAFTGLRFLIGALAIMPLMQREARRATEPLRQTHLRGFVACGVMLFLASWLQQRGIEHTSASNAGFYTSIYVVLTPFISWLWLRIRPHALLWPAIGVTTLGMWLMNGGSLTAFSTGDLWVVASSVFWALQITLVGVFAARSNRPLTLACTQFMSAGLLGTALALVLTPLEFANATAIWPELLWSSIVSVGIAFTLQVIAQRHLQPAVAAIIMGSEMLFAALAGALFLQERLTGLQLTGGALIFLAIVLVEAVPQLSAYTASSTRTQNDSA